MKITKKKVLAGILAASIFTVGMFAGNTALGNSSWSTSIVNTANATLVKTGSDKIKELATGTNIDAEMKNLMQPEIESQQSELERLLEEYYQMKLDGLTDTPEFKEVEGRIEAIRQALFDRYKSEIDAIFE